MSDHGGWPANTTSDPGCDSSNAPGSEPERTISMSTKNQRGLALSGARVLITGAGSGIGRLMALGAARRGAGEVILWDLSAERAGAVKAEVEAAGATASVGIVDVADRTAVADAADRKSTRLNSSHVAISYAVF